MNKIDVKKYENCKIHLASLGGYQQCGKEGWKYSTVHGNVYTMQQSREFHEIIFGDNLGIFKSWHYYWNTPILAYIEEKLYIIPISINKCLETISGHKKNLGTYQPYGLFCNWSNWEIMMG